MAKRRKPLLRPLGLGEILASTKLGKRGARILDLYQVQKHWPEIVGGLMAERTLPKMVNGKVLIVKVENAAWAQHLSMMKEDVLKAIKAKLGTTFSDLRFVNEPLHFRNSEPSQNPKVQ